MTPEELADHMRWARRIAAGMWLDGSAATRVFLLVQEVRQLQKRIDELEKRKPEHRDE